MATLFKFILGSYDAYFKYPVFVEIYDGKPNFKCVRIMSIYVWFYIVLLYIH